ncbi:MAG TPA: hypothetical protein VJ547_03615 [Candidatus Thermoplasmatota archaeon]|nr:hypothetical protein [Candidatus Thermoplasmatota archaeon]
MNPPPPTKEARLEELRGNLLDSSEQMQNAKGKASRAKAEFARARGPDGRRRARRALVSALGDLRSATLAQEVARAALRRDLSHAGRAAFDDLLERFDRTMEHYGEVSRLFEEHSAAYDSARARYREEREWVGRQSRIPHRFDVFLSDLEEALTLRDKALTDAHRAHRRTLEILSKAFAASDEHQRRPTPSNKIRRDEALARARSTFADAERQTQGLARALSRWFEADKTFTLGISALEASRGFAEVQRLQLFALQMLRANARLSLASIVTDEALSQVTDVLAEVRGLK